jgi:hypothetical protein
MKPIVWWAAVVLAVVGISGTAEAECKMTPFRQCMMQYAGSWVDANCKGWYWGTRHQGAIDHCRAQVRAGRAAQHAGSRGSVGQSR